MKRQLITSAIAFTALTISFYGCGSTSGTPTAATNSGSNHKSYHLQQVQTGNNTQTQQGMRTIHISTPANNNTPTNTSNGNNASNNGTATSTTQSQNANSSSAASAKKANSKKKP